MACSTTVALIFVYIHRGKEVMTSEGVMDVGADMVGMIKTNIKGLCKYTIKNLKKYWPGGFYLVLKRNYVVPGGRPLIAIG